MPTHRKGYVPIGNDVVYGSAFVKVPPQVQIIVMESRKGLFVVGPRGTLKHCFNYSCIRIYKANDRMVEVKGWLTITPPIASFPLCVCRSIEIMILGVMFGFSWKLRGKPNKYINYTVDTDNRTLVINNTYNNRVVHARVSPGINIYSNPDCPNTIRIEGNRVDALAKTAAYLKNRSTFGKYYEGLYVFEKNHVENIHKYDSL